jgi:hypothetical protein
MPPIAILVAAALDRSGSSPEELEHDVDRVVDILEGEAGSIAIGPAVGCDFERSLIEMRFSVEGESSAAIHRSIGNIAEMIDQALGGQVKTATTTAEQAELACA